MAVCNLPLAVRVVDFMPYPLQPRRVPEACPASGGQPMNGCP
ncbi:hypothetical protein [Lysobacter gummosus]